MASKTPVLTPHGGFTVLWKNLMQLIKPIALQTGVFYTGIGKSNQEIAALSRSRHQSQGFVAQAGEETEYLEFINGEPLQAKNLF
jgi:hypothetical protein